MDHGTSLREAQDDDVFRRKIISLLPFALNDKT
jgi:hypothetical protein